MNTKHRAEAELYRTPFDHPTAGIEEGTHHE